MVAFLISKETEVSKLERIRCEDYRNLGENGYGEGEGLLFYGNVILPFIDRFPTDLELYRIITTKLNEVAQEKEA